MSSIALIIVCLLVEIVQLQALQSYTVEQPSCSSGARCADVVDSTTKPNYTAAKEDPKYKMTNEELAAFTFTELHGHLDCYDHALSQTKSMYTEDMYNHMRAKYSALTGYKFEALSNDQDVFHIATSEGAGRGVFASRDIKKGEIIPFSKTCSVVTFTDGQLWKQYVVSLPRMMACDVLEWTWSQNVQTMGDVRLCLSIGDGDSYLNNADIDEDINIAPTSLTSMMFEATKDIMKGEELIYDYELFEPTAYEMFGLGSL